jgi:hypothetical protein
VLEAETAREQHRPDSNASASETTPVKVKKLGHVVVTIYGLNGLNDWNDWNNGFTSITPVFV